MRRVGRVLFMTIFMGIFAQSAAANCAIIDRIDQIHTLQTRLLQNPDSGLFGSDIRQIRVLSHNLSSSAVVDAVDGNAFTGQGARVARFLQNTKDLLRIVSLDDPQSVRPHFTNAVRRNLQAMGEDLRTLRCDLEDIRNDQAQGVPSPELPNSTDAEDLAEVADALSNIAEEVLQLRSLFILLFIVGIVSFGVPAIRQWRLLRLRKAKRHNTVFDTQYRMQSDQIFAGTLLDINCHGTKLQHNADTPHDKGDSVAVSIDEHWIKGTVIWSNNFYSGVKFNKDINLSQVESVCRTSQDNKGGNKRKTAPQGTPSQNTG